MVQFALRLGVRHSAISRYESGKLTPSRSMLIMLFQLAVHPEEKNLILSVMGVDGSLRGGWGEKELLEAIREFDIYENAKEVEAKFPRRAWKKGSLMDFAEKAKLIVKQVGDVDPSLVEILSAWIRYHGEPRAVEHFRDVAAFLTVKLSKYANEQVAAQIQRKGKGPGKAKKKAVV